MDFLKGWNGALFFVAVLVLAATVETVLPWRRTDGPRLQRWMRAASLWIYGSLLSQYLAPVTGFASAVFAQTHSIGLLNFVNVPVWVQVLITVVVLDLTAFLQHRALHEWPLLWRAHRVHHSDVEIDAATSLRFHPLETGFRVITQAPVILLLGLPPEAFLIGFAVLTIINVYTHINVRMPSVVEQSLSRVLITPAAHRLHHSVEERYSERNFGGIFNLWDRLGATYCDGVHLSRDMEFGLGGEDALSRESFASLLLDPFRRLPAHGR